MSRIKTLHLNNFKFFDEQKPIELDGKHLLLFGENGSGKSSVYWALYTLFECANKEHREIQKYFHPPSEKYQESLVNIYAKKIKSKSKIATEHSNAFLTVTTDNAKPKKFEVSLLNQKISGNPNAQEINKASDFLNYKVLYKFQDFWNGQPINLADIFLGYILPYVKFDELEYKKQNISNAFEMFNSIQEGPELIIVDKVKKQPGKKTDEYKSFKKLVTAFDNSFLKLIEFINANAYDIIKKLGYDIEFDLQYEKLKKQTKKIGSHNYYYAITFKITKYLGEKIYIQRPQSFLNEAKITAIAIAIRLAILKKRFTDQAPDVLKFIVFDDVMISLDMNNRDKLIDYILNPANKFTADYQLLFLTHDKNLFDFVANKIKQWDKIDNWLYKEMYAGKDIATQKEYPIIIDSDLEFIDKAQKYFDAKDYTACSIYIRKEVEKIVNQRLPPVLKEKVDGNFLSLETLWKNMVERYKNLGINIDATLLQIFKETKLLVLNPQAHFQEISLPIYKVELEKAFYIINELKTKYPIPVYTIVLSKGMKMQFKHPTVNYSFDFELISDLYIDGMNGTTIIEMPKCRVLSWQFNAQAFWDIPTSSIKIPAKPIEQKLNKIIEQHTANVKVPLNITNDIFIKNTSIENSIWSFKEIIDKAGITL